jgi:glycosyltransferase involved in cell wall biosynthesis
MFHEAYFFDKIKGKSLPNLLDYYFNLHMRDKILECLIEEKYDLIYCARTMANYVQDTNIPKVVQPFDATYEWNRQMFLNSKGMNKAIYYIMYKMAKSYESTSYKKFDACLFVTQKDKELINNISPKTNCVVLPNGVNTQYFKPIDVAEDFPSLVYVSDMSGYTTIENVHFFYNEIYPHIQKEIPNTKIYLVGRNPAKEISNLASDSNVIVTGTVDDVRPYIAKASIFIAPMIMGTGIKNKVLEAMAMGKAVVTTTIGSQGIDGISGKDFLVTDDPSKFAKFTVQLLRDKNFRELLGDNARTLIEKSYSWEITAKKLNELFNSLGTVTK